MGVLYLLNWLSSQMNEKEIRALACKWCPLDNAALCQDKEWGCDSVSALVKELVYLCDKCIYRMIAREQGDL